VCWCTKFEFLCFCVCYIEKGIVPFTFILMYGFQTNGLFTRNIKIRPDDMNLVSDDTNWSSSIRVFRPKIRVVRPKIRGVQHKICISFKHPNRLSLNDYFRTPAEERAGSFPGLGSVSVDSLETTYFDRDLEQAFVKFSRNGFDESPFRPKSCRIMLKCFLHTKTAEMNLWLDKIRGLNVIKCCQAYND
jgi:hypothetical protein